MNFLSIITLVYDYTLIGLNIYEFLLFLYVIASMFGVLPKNAMGQFLHDIISPVLRLMQKLPHTFGPIDFSPIYAFLLIGLIRYLVMILFSLIS